MSDLTFLIGGLWAFHALAMFYWGRYVGQREVTGEGKTSQDTPENT